MNEVVVVSNSSALTTGGILGMIYGAMGMASVIIGIAWFILDVIACWKIFKKAGKPGWHSIIPILNTWDEIDLSWSRKMAWTFLGATICSSIVGGIVDRAAAAGGSPSGFFVVLSYILSVVLIVIGVISTYKLAKAFGKGFGFFIGLLLLNPIFKMILGFGSAQYQGRQGN